MFDLGWDGVFIRAAKISQLIYVQKINLQLFSQLNDHFSHLQPKMQVRIYHYSQFYMVINWISLGFELLVKENTGEKYLLQFLKGQIEASNCLIL